MSLCGTDFQPKALETPDINGMNYQYP